MIVIFMYVCSVAYIFFNYFSLVLQETIGNKKPLRRNRVAGTGEQA